MSPRVSLQEAAYRFTDRLAPLGRSLLSLSPEQILNADGSDWRLGLVRHRRLPEVPGQVLVGQFGGPQFGGPGVEVVEPLDVAGVQVGDLDTVLVGVYTVADAAVCAGLHVDNTTRCPYTCQYTIRAESQEGCLT